MVINKNLYRIFLFLGIIIFSLVPLISAQDVCCHKLIEGPWCQNAPIEQCNLSAGTPAPTSCEQTTYCASGTCMDEGTCMPNTPKIRCEIEGGSWDEREVSEIASCQEGCCVIGDTSYFVSQTECNRLSTEYLVSTDFRSNVNTEESCSALANPSTEGACVFDNLDCKMSTKESCLSQGGNFGEGYLCTATHLQTNCAKTGNTRCGEDGRVYFTDSCGNLANVYDEDMFAVGSIGWTQDMEKYWTYIKEPTCGEGTNECGNCDYISGTMCREYKQGTFGMQRPEFGDYTCASLSCTYDLDGDGTPEEYEHGESWCRPSPGADLVIEIDNDSFITQESREELENNYEDYNLPGSRYARMYCNDGEVVTEPCKDYRNEYCVEGASESDPDYSIAGCVENTARNCFDKTLQEDCEDENSVCKWIPGYRFDRETVTYNRGDYYDEIWDSGRNQKSQGSCVPLISIGFQSRFTGEETEEELLAQSGLEICKNISVAEPVIYETNALASRDKFSDVGVDKAAHRCISNCYILPEFGIEYTIGRLMDIYAGGEFDDRDHHISLRQFHYCDKNVFGSMGHMPVVGKDADCAKKEEKRRDFPIFFTHEEWLNSIKKRAYSVGDCGYKPGAYVNLEEVDKNLEEIKVGFVKLDQQGQPKDEIILETIYEGNNFIPGAYRSS